MEKETSEIFPKKKKKIIISHLIENLADSQEQYQMAFIKCQYTNDYLLTVHQSWEASFWQKERIWKPI